MSLPFDATLKDLVREFPADWLAQLGAPLVGEVKLLTPDLSTLTAFADIVLQIGNLMILHIEFQTGPDPRLPRRVLLYNAVLHDHTGLPVHSVVVLLRPRADRGDLTGRIGYEPIPGRGSHHFLFEVVRLWERPVEELLASGLGTLPLATLGRLPEGVAPEVALPAIIERLAARVVKEASPPVAAHLLTAAFVLTGLRISPQESLRIFQGVHPMNDLSESTTYQWILDQGGLREARRIIRRQGRIRFGAPTAAEEAAVEAIADPERLEYLSERVLTAVSWQELLAVP